MWKNMVSCYRQINPTPTETNRLVTHKPVVNPGMFYVLCSYANKIIWKYTICIKLLMKCLVYVFGAIFWVALLFKYFIVTIAIHCVSYYESIMSFIMIETEIGLNVLWTKWNWNMVTLVM